MTERKPDIAVITVSPNRRYLQTMWLILSVIGWVGSGLAQHYDNPVTKALAGANSAVTRGFLCVGQNPANLGMSTPYRTYFQAFGINYYITNNFYSLETGRHFGRDLTADDGALQAEFLRKLPTDGWRFDNGFNSALPFVNFSLGNKALTTNLIYTNDLYLSRPVLDVVFGGVEKGKLYQLDMRWDAMTAIEYAYSMAIPYENIAVGLSLKYLQGLGYYGLDPRYNTGQIVVDTARFLLCGDGEYYFRESYAGRGYGADIGIAVEDVYGWNMGISLLNIGESVKWNSETMISKVLKDLALRLMGQQLRSGLIKTSDIKLDFKGEDFRYRFTIDSLNAEKLFRGDSTFQALLQSNKRITRDSTVFRVPLPLVLKIGLARRIQPNLLMALDFTASFSDRFGYTRSWRSAVGFEYTPLPRTPLRVGLAVGGLSGWEFDIGSGLAWGPLHVDWAFGFHRGVWAHTAQGVNFSLGAYLTGKGKVQ